MFLLGAICATFLQGDFLFCWVPSIPTGFITRIE